MSSNGNSSGQELLQEGKNLFERRQFAAAEKIFLKLSEKGARYADVLNMLGLIYHRDGRFNDAISSFEEALKINPDYREALLNLAVLYHDVGEYPKAKKLYARLRTGKGKVKSRAGVDPILMGSLANQHASLGDIYLSIDHPKDAVEEYQKALKLCPEFLDIRVKLAVAYRDNKQKALALQELRRVLRQNPQNVQALLQLGMSFFTSGDKKKAEKTWKEILAKNPHHEIAEMYLRLCQ